MPNEKELIHHIAEATKSVSERLEEKPVTTSPTWTTKPEKEESIAKQGYGALRIVASVVAGLATILTVSFTVDARYVHAQELRLEGIKQQRQLLELHTSNLDDRVFELQIRKTAAPKSWTTTDQLILNRYKEKLNQVREANFTLKDTQKALQQQSEKK